MWEDSIVAEVRRIKEELAARFNFDVKAIFADLRKCQASMGMRVVSPKKQAASAPAVNQEGKSVQMANPESISTELVDHM